MWGERREEQRSQPSSFALDGQLLDIAARSRVSSRDLTSLLLSISMELQMAATAGATKRTQRLDIDVKRIRQSIVDQARKLYIVSPPEVEEAIQHEKEELERRELERYAELRALEEEDVLQVTQTQYYWVIFSLEVVYCVSCFDRQYYLGIVLILSIPSHFHLDT
jgi:hypothetical protein